MCCVYFVCFRQFHQNFLCFVKLPKEISYNDSKLIFLSVDKHRQLARLIAWALNDTKIWQLRFPLLFVVTSSQQIPNKYSVTRKIFFLLHHSSCFNLKLGFEVLKKFYLVGHVEKVESKIDKRLLMRSNLYSGRTSKQRT